MSKEAGDHKQGVAAVGVFAEKERSQERKQQGQHKPLKAQPGTTHAILKPENKDAIQHLPQNAPIGAEKDGGQSGDDEAQDKSPGVFYKAEKPPPVKQGYQCRKDNGADQNGVGNAEQGKKGEAAAINKCISGRVIIESGVYVPDEELET